MVARLETYSLLCAILTWVVVEDVRTRKIRNWVTLVLIVTGMAASVTPYGGITARESLVGLLVGFAPAFFMFAVGGMGGGDVKLMAGVGAWIGPWPVLTVFVVAAVVGSVLGLGMSLWQGRMVTVLRNTLALGTSLLNAPRLGLEHVRDVGQACGGTKRGLPYAVPIWIATVLTLFTPVGTLFTGS
ncbi:MAG TPA: A24 family peptidase [Tepidisphaeraceae bacterium]|nr:A24 family peptidase [Tepidisphaeraceae bacterium]